jgi:hypothetical protein
VVGFDEYDRKARLTPGLIAVAPIAFAIAALGWKEYPAVAIATAVIAGSGATYLLAILVRSLGRRVEPSLWVSWGGPPTTALLRTRTPADNVVLRDRWRAAVESFTGVALLSASDEAADPSRADETIEAAVRQLLHLGNNPEYPLVKAENIQYGFERNFYGVRWVGRAIAAACVLLLGGVLAAGATETSTGAVVAGLVINACFVLGWCLLPSVGRTRSSAERYANQLLQATVVESRRPGAQP